jgi:CRISPR/Cas system CSM-associated protein Csm3 (group 7 of RAMP superfamily)
MMVYCIEFKTVVKGKLLVVRSLHVGGFGTSSNVDLLLAINGKGHVYIPGTSLAGALRGWMSQLCEKQVVRDLWGFQADKPDQQPTQEKKGHASRIIVEDAEVTLPNGKPMTRRDTEIRSGVGIDRHRGAAAANYLYNRGVIPRDATLDFQLSIEIPEGADSKVFQDSIDQLLLALTTEEIRIGAAKSRGLGRVKLISDQLTHPITQNTLKDSLPTAQTFTLNTRDGLLSFLAYRAKPIPILPDWQKPTVLLTLPRLLIKLDWQPIGPLMVKSELTGALINILPLMSSVNGDQLAFLLPGSSIKGALRTHAERIVRTVRSHPLDSDDLKEQIKGLPLIDTLFGFSADSDSEPTPQKERKSKWAKGLGALLIEDCFSKPIHPADTLQRLSQIPKDNPEALDKVLQETALTTAKQETQVAYHVAIDRWTGGAAEGFLYTNLEPFHILWEPIELAIDFNRFPSDAPEGDPEEASSEDKLAGVALLLLLLRDLGDRRIPLGYGTNRGLGTLALNKVTFEAKGAVPKVLKALAAKPWQTQENKPLSFAQLDATALKELDEAWQQWLTRLKMAEPKGTQEVETYD